MSDVEVEIANAKLECHKSLLELIYYILQGGDLALWLHEELPNWALLRLMKLEDNKNLPDNVKLELTQYIEELRDKTDVAIGPFPPAEDE